MRNDFNLDYSPQGFNIVNYRDESHPCLTRFNNSVKPLLGKYILIEKPSELLKASSLFPTDYQNFIRVLNFPSIFLGLGILGTFIGLTFGLSQLTDFTNNDSLLTQVQGLISGMRLAFITSIIGMSFSILGSFTLNKSKKNIAYIMNTIIGYISTQFEYIDKLEYLLSSTYTLKGEETPLYLRTIDILHRNMEFNESTSKATVSMNNDLATSISNGISHNIEPTLNNLNRTIEGFVIDNKNGAQDTISKVIESLESSMKEMVTQFKDMISEDTKNELDSMAKMLKESGEYFIKIPTVLEEILVMIEDQQKEQLKHYQAINQEVDTSIVSFNAEVNRYQDSIAKFENTYGRFTGTLKQLESFFDRERDSHIKIGSFMDGFVTSMNHQNQSMSETLRSMSQYLSEIRSTGQEIDGVFRTVNSNINQYENEVGNSLNRYLESYSGAVEQFTDKLETAVNSLQGLLGDIDDKRLVRS
ncbi:MAG: hypothetical protein JXR86_09000 [Spirochaetales bacterium]|nr:hypothetical protein [Spirochaetales bacterium]